MMQRRSFIQFLAAYTTAMATGMACKPALHRYPGEMITGSAEFGHMLREGFPPPDFKEPAEQVDCVIVGAGVSGLSAAYHLEQAGITDFLVLDLESQAGGNAVGGTNAVSGYPWGAHYIPIPNPGLAEYHRFLEDAGVITGWENDKPVYNELFLCFDPEERLYINGKWQDGLVPDYGLPEKDRSQIRRFLQLMNEFRYAKDKKGVDAFAIPVMRSSDSPEWRSLDDISILTWLQQQQLTSPFLAAYVNYCTKDDYGTEAKDCSAWAAIHYFAGRKGIAANATHSDVLTWPEGNQYLVNQLIKNNRGRIHTDVLVTSVTIADQHAHISCYHRSSRTWKKMVAKKVVLAVPQMVRAKLLHEPERMQIQQQYQYAPWMVANLTITEPQERNGAAMSWDNVQFDGRSLGYVDATHQLLNSRQLLRNITYYQPLTGKTPREARMEAYQKTFQQWSEDIVSDLKRIHPDIENCIQNIKVKLWGHAMPQPRPGFLFNEDRRQLQLPVEDIIHPAHADLSGISIFEEAFYQGYDAAQKIIAQRKAQR